MSTDGGDTRPTSPLEVVDWHQRLLARGIEDARQQIYGQMKMHVISVSFAIAAAGVLLTFAGFLGYKDAVDRAVKSVKASIDDDVRRQIVAEAVSDLKPKVEALVSAKALEEATARMIASSDQRYLQLNEPYWLKNPQSDLFLGVFMAGKDRKRPVSVDATAESYHTWRFVRPNAP